MTHTKYQATLTRAQTAAVNKLQKHAEYELVEESFTKAVDTALTAGQNDEARKQSHFNFAIALTNIWPRLRELSCYKELEKKLSRMFVEGKTMFWCSDKQVTGEATDRPGSAPKPPKPTIHDVAPQPFDLIVAKKYTMLHKSAMSRGLDWDLELVDIVKILKRKTCYYTGVTMTSEVGSTQRTVDRIDSDKGYVKGNIVACTHAANQLKNYLFENEQSEIYITRKQLDRMLSKLPR